MRATEGFAFSSGIARKILLADNTPRPGGTTADNPWLRTPCEVNLLAADRRTESDAAKHGIPLPKESYEPQAISRELRVEAVLAARVTQRDGALVVSMPEISVEGVRYLIKITSFCASL
jgi:hypothetical protein